MSGKFTSAIFLFLALAVMLTVVPAQSTILTIPSTDVVGKKKVYVEFDYYSRLEDHNQGGFTTLVPRVVFGLGKGLEVGANMQMTNSLTPDNPVEIQPNVKWQYFNSEKHGVATAVGVIGYVTMANRQNAANDFAMFHTSVSKKFKQKYGPRVSVGGYQLANYNATSSNNGGATIAYEQPLHSRVSFVTDWFSGNNRFSYVTPGLAWSLPKGTFYTCYTVGNKGARNNALYLYYGVTF